jgi:E3 ubiquitin-protein ligase TRIP12
VIDISLNKIFLKSVLEEAVPLSISSVKAVDSALGKSLSTLRRFVNAKQNIEGDSALSQNKKAAALEGLQLDGVRLEDLCLDFTVPGFEDMELKVGSSPGLASVYLLFSRPMVAIYQ